MLQFAGTVLIVLALIALAGHSVLGSRSTWTIGQSVNTTSGIIIGHTAPNKTNISEYLGIPYAQAATGNLRFAPPVAYNNKALFNATKFSPACPVVQQTPGATNSARETPNVNLTAAGNYLAAANGEVLVGEDCLSINIWTKPQASPSLKPVMVWVYGGAFTSGNSDNPLYNGQYLADQEDVVVVSFNYRINIFGFPGVPAGKQSQNVGLLDQRLAIEWVRDNIANFGGDPARIILFGQSAGANSIDLYTYTYTSDPIVAGFILESGTTALLPPLNASSSARIWYNVTNQLGCGNASSNASSVLSCMRSVNYTDILAALKGQNFYPTIDDRLVLNASAYTSLAQSGNYIKVPLLIGNNDNEAAIFRVQYIEEGVTTLDALSAEPAYNEQRWTCPAAIRANASVSHDVPTWRYRWFGVFSNTNLTTDPNSGAYHGSEVPIVFNTAPGPAQNSSVNTMEEDELIAYIQAAWASFARDPVNGLTKFGWPSYNPAEPTLLRLGDENRVGLNASLPELYDAPCGDQFPISLPSPNGTTNHGAPSSTATAPTAGSTSFTPDIMSAASGLQYFCFRGWGLSMIVAATIGLWC